MPLCKVWTDRMTWVKDEKEFVTEASEILERSLPHQIPEEFEVISQWTGKIVVVRKASTNTDDDGDITFWKYVPKEHDLREKFCVIVFND